MNEEFKTYNDKQPSDDKAICNLPAQTIDSKLKAGWRLMFWSGAYFDEDNLKIRGDKFKDAPIFFATVEQINTKDMK